MIVFHQARYGTGVHSTFADGKFDGKRMYICKTCEKFSGQICVCVMWERSYKENV